jgi:hypothetical protein
MSQKEHVEGIWNDFDKKEKVYFIPDLVSYTILANLRENKDKFQLNF